MRKGNVFLINIMNRQKIKFDITVCLSEWAFPLCVGAYGVNGRLFTVAIQVFCVVFWLRRVDYNEEGNEQKRVY